MIVYLKKHWIKVCVIALIFIVSMGRFQYKMPKRQFADFHVNYYTGQKMLKGGNVYDIEAYRKDKMANFKYPPLFASITALFAICSERTAATIWFIFNYFLIILFMCYSGKMIFGEELAIRQKNWIYFWSLFLTSRFYLQNFDAGQVNFLMMTTILLGLYAAQRRKEFLSGLLIGFSILVKYMGAIFIPYFLIKKRFKLVSYILFSLIFYSFLPALFWGWQKNLFMQSQYLPYVCKTSLDMFSLSDEANQSLMAMIVRLFSTHGHFCISILFLKDYQLSFVTGACYVLIFLFCLYPARINNDFKPVGKFDNVDLGLLFACAALFNPNAWMHAFIFLTFGYMVIISYLFKNGFKDKAVLALTILSFVFHSFTTSFFTRFWSGELFEIYSFVTIGAILTLSALFRIKFFPKEISH